MGRSHIGGLEMRVNLGKAQLMVSALLFVGFGSTRSLAGPALFDPGVADYSTQIKNAAVVLKARNIQLPVPFRINVPQTKLPDAAAEIVYRWEKELDAGYTAQPPTLVTDLGDAPNGQSPGSVRAALKAGGRYACASKRREGDPQYFAKATHSDQADIAARAVLGKKAGGANEVMIFAGHTTVYAMRGKDFNSIARDCEHPLYTSHDRRDFESRRNTEWLSTLYTRDGRKIYGFMNNDWRAYNLPSDERGRLAFADPTNARYSGLHIGNESRWWWASLTSAVLTDNASAPHAGFRIPAGSSSNSIIASPAMEGRDSERNKFDPNDRSLDWFNGAGRNGVTGFVHTTNIVKSPVNGSYYMFMKRFRNVARGATRAEADANVGFCLLRASPNASLEQGAAWQGYTTQTGYTRDLRSGECDFVFMPDTVFRTSDGGSLEVDSIRHLSYNSYLRKFVMLVKANVKAPGTSSKTEVLALLTTSSADLLDWASDPAQVLMPTDLLLPGKATRSRADGTRYGAALDVKSEVQYYSMIDHDYRELVDEMIIDGRLPRAEKDERRNFDITGSQPWIYISLKRSVLVNGVWENKALDVVRFPIRLEKR